MSPPLPPRNIPKLYMYVARDAPICAILRRGNRKKEWEWIKWNLATDTFTEGQWLMGKVILPALCGIHPDGTQVGYVYYDIRYRDYNKEYLVYSTLPNMTADELIHYDHFYYGHPYNREFQGRKKDGEWIDFRGRTIRTEGGIVYVDGMEIYDTRHHRFVARPPLR